jgi:hypothetical protein
MQTAEASVVATPAVKVVVCREVRTFAHLTART